MFLDVQLKGGNAFVGDAKDFKEGNPGFCFAIFVTRVRQVRLKTRARDLISFQDRGAGRSIRWGV